MRTGAGVRIAVRITRCPALRWSVVARTRDPAKSRSHTTVCCSLPEFDRYALEVLREPLETGQITISRNARQAEFPARFQLIAAMNPCPCGHLGDPGSQCRCPPERIEAYRGRISGPLLDRIDLHVDVPRLPAARLRSEERAEGSEIVALRVASARGRQLARQGRTNAQLTAAEMRTVCRVERTGTELLERAAEKFAFSARGYHRVLRVARTIADLADAEHVDAAHIAEAVTWRQLDRRSESAGEDSGHSDQ
jgi:magnesium chelatase family protein